MTARAVRLAVLPIVAALLLGGCGGTKSLTFRDAASGIAFRYPVGWSVTGFSRTVSPPRLVVASYRVKRGEVEGDCGGQRALTSAPQSGAVVLLLDYGNAAAGGDFRPRPKHFVLRQFARGDYECFGDSYMLRFVAAGHHLQAHLKLGERAGAARRRQLLLILDSLARAGRGDRQRVTTVTSSRGRRGELVWFNTSL